MSSATYSTAQFQLPLRTTGRALSQLASELVALFEGAVPPHPQPGPEGSILTLCLAIKQSLGLGDDGCIEAEHQGDTFNINASGEGRHNRLLETITILAAHDVTGEVCFEDTDLVHTASMRYRLADGIVHIGRGNLVYVEDPAETESPVS
ncbi:hypothetical protein ABIE52_006863 [Rhodococcus sp. OAS809]|uniref:hypothetical protein n=1 Tax=Rhodococcus sp. OAS809 TaxID=2663874 RepID=UPI001789A6A6